jgi:hypothetical protein
MCTVCLSLDGLGCENSNNQGTPNGANGVQYCPPCVCKANEALIMFGYSLSQTEALAMCQGDYKHCP